MKVIGYEEAHEFLEDFLLQKLTAQGRNTPTELPEECDLLLSGLIDSLGILELLTALSHYCGREIDFEALDPDQMTIVGPLCRFVSAQNACTEQSGSEIYDVRH